MKTASARTKLVTRILTVGLITAAAMGGIYAAAASSAVSIVASFDPVETRAHARSIEFSTQAARAAAQHNTDLAKCQRFAGQKRKACNAAAKFRNARGL